VASGDLHVAKAHARVQHGRHERMAKHVRMHPRHPDPSGPIQLDLHWRPLC
jgi:hypothetical protein